MAPKKTFDPDHERELIRIAQDKAGQFTTHSQRVKARAELLHLYEGTGHDILRKMQGSKLDPDLKEAAMRRGINTAISTYSPDKGAAPNTWVTRLVHKELLNLHSQFQNELYVPPATHFLLGRIETAKAALRADGVPDPTPEQVWKELAPLDEGRRKDTTLDAVRKAMGGQQRVMIMNGSGEDEEGNLGDALMHPVFQGGDPMVGIRQREQVEDLNAAVKTLPEPDRAVYTEYYGLGGAPAVPSYRVLALRHGLSTYGVGQALRRAEARLRVLLAPPEASDE